MINCLEQYTECKLFSYETMTTIFVINYWKGNVVTIEAQIFNDLLTQVSTPKPLRETEVGYLQ